VPPVYLFMHTNTNTQEAQALENSPAERTVATPYTAAAERLVTIQELAQRRRQCVMTIRRHIKAGHIPQPQRIFNRLVWPESQVANF
jgi:predicted DNA-binding transcriptional regulator AlpA